VISICMGFNAFLIYKLC